MGYFLTQDDGDQTWTVWKQGEIADEIVKDGFATRQEALFFVECLQKQEARSSVVKDEIFGNG